MPRTLSLIALLLSTLAPALSQTWTTGAPMPTSREGVFTGVINNKIYVIGGANPNAVSVNEIYDPVANTWSTGAPMPTARWIGGAAVVNNILYCIGGGDTSGGTVYTTVEAYNPATNTWATKSPIPVATDSVNAIAFNNLIYVVGGFSNAGGRLANVQVYNPATDSWTPAANLLVGKSESALGVVGSMLISALGLTGSGVTPEAEGYNPTTNTWTHLASSPNPRDSPCFTTFGTKLYVAGGSTIDNQTALASMDAYDAATNTWTTGLPAMPHAVVVPGSVNYNNTLYCFGGSSNGNPVTGTYYNYVQIFHPAQTPAISAAISASGFGAFSSAAPGSYVEVYGTNLSTDSRGWLGSDFQNNTAPTALDGTTATIGGQSAFVNFISPGQIDVQLPSNAPTGPQPLIVSVNGTPSTPFTLTINPLQPGLLSPTNFNSYVAAILSDGTFVAPPNAIPGVSSRRAKAGDTLLMFGVGFGPVNPSTPAGQITQQLNSLTNNLQIKFAGVPATINYAGLAPSNVGLYQFNVVVPANVLNSDTVPVTFTLGATQGTQTLITAIQN